MQFNTKINTIKTENKLAIAFDIGQQKLNCYSQWGNEIIHFFEDEFINRIPVIEAKLVSFYDYAVKNGFNGLHIVCEPTGGYEQKLMQTALRLGHKVSYVNGESVNKFQVVENNENDKSDPKDPRVIFKLYLNGKLVKYRQLDQEYAQLRALGRFYEQDSKARTDVKNLIHDTLKVLFPDFSFGNAFLFQTSGRALLKQFSANPYKMIKAGKTQFRRRMKKDSPRIRTKTLDRLWQDALCSVRMNMDDSLIDIYQQRIKKLWTDYITLESNLKDIKESMEQLYDQLLDAGEQVPVPVKSFVSKLNLSRIVAQTGPFSDFASGRQIKRFGGLHLKVRQSGKYKGKVKLSKKGRVDIRTIMAQSIFHLIKKQGLFGQFFHAKKDNGMPGTKAMTVVMRKMVDVLFALSKPGVVFDPNRLFSCENQHQNAA